tara:strand:+ start:1053 stop:1403 length:351 start_codon:yes stop_codon:yes gene_type:complete
MFLAKARNLFSKAKAGIVTGYHNVSNLANQIHRGFGVAKETYKAIAPHAQALAKMSGSEAAQKAVGAADSLADRAIDKYEDLRGKAMEAQQKGMGVLKDLSMRGADIMSKMPAELK